MRYGTIIRNKSTDDGTFGVLLMDDHSSWSTGELPWHDNAHGISCILPGTYKCTWFNSPKHGWGYLVNDVPDRNLCEIHPANFMADKSIPTKQSQLLGCIALGKSVGKLEGQTALLQSKQAILEFDTNLKMEEFQLTITWATTT